MTPEQRKRLQEALALLRQQQQQPAQSQPQPQPEQPVPPPGGQVYLPTRMKGNRPKPPPQTMLPFQQRTAIPEQPSGYGSRFRPTELEMGEPGSALPVPINPQDVRQALPPQLRTEPKPLPEPRFADLTKPVQPPKLQRPGMSGFDYTGEVKMPPVPTDPIKEDEAPPYPAVPKQPTPEEYGLGDGIKRFIGGRWQEAQTKVAEAGQGEYVSIFGKQPDVYGEDKEPRGLAAITYNIGQWNPMDVPVGKGLTALAQSALLVLDTPAQVTERAIGHQTTGRLREQLGVGDDPVKESAFQAALGVTYSGPEAIANVYEDALELAQAGQLDASNAERVQAKHGVWWRELGGQIVLDPLNLLSAPGKAASQVRRLRQAEKLYQIPDLVKVGDNAIPRATKEIAEEMASLSTRTGQAREAEGLLDTAAAWINPRHTSAVRARTAERVSQVINWGAESLQRRTLQKMDNLVDVNGQKLVPGTQVYEEKFVEMLGANLEAMATNFVKLASDNVDDVEQAARELSRLGMGKLPLSKYGRRTGIILREVVGKGSEAKKSFHAIMEEVKAAGGTAEEVAEIWTERIAKVMDDLIPGAKWEKSIPIKTAQGITNTMKPVTDTYAKLFMGMSLGYPLRNMADNMASLVMLHWSPFKPSRKFAEATGMVIPGAARGIGAVGEKAQGPLWATFGLRAGQKMESISSTWATYQFYKDAVDRLLPNALTELRKAVPEGADPHLVKSFERAAEMALSSGDAGDIERIGQELKRFIDLAADEGAAAAAVPPPGSAVKSFTELWRQPSSQLMKAIKGTGDGLWDEVYEVISKAETPEDAVTQINKLKSDILAHVGEVGRKAPDPGHVMGTPAGAVVNDLASSGVKIPQKTMNELAENLGKAQHSLEQSRAKAINAIKDNPNSAEWMRWIDECETEYLAAVEGIKLSQVGDYALLVAKEIDEAEYVRRTLSEFNQVKSALDYKYRQIIGELSRPQITQSFEEAIRPLLKRELVRTAAAEGNLPSAVLKGWEPLSVAEVRHSAEKATFAMPEAHFQNKLRQVVGRQDIKNINDLTDDELITAINAFREPRGLPKVTPEEIFERATAAPTEIKPLIKEKITNVPMRELNIDFHIPPNQLDFWNKQYHITEDGSPIFETIKDVTDPRWEPSYDVGEYLDTWNRITFKRFPDGQIMATRGGGHIPGVEAVFHAEVNDKGDVLLIIGGKEIENIGAYADDLVRSGLSPETEIEKIPTALLKDFPELKDVGTLGDLTTSDLGMAAYFIDEGGRKVYVPWKGKTGPITKDEYVEFLNENIADLVNSPDEAVKTALASVRKALDEPIAFDPPPTLIGGSIEGARQEIALLDELLGEIDEFKKLPAPPAPPPEIAAEIATDWDAALERLAGLHFETHTMAAEAGRRARDHALLDYRDRRYFDTIMKTVFPWGYWASRKLPNWSTSVMMNPAMAAHYTKFKREIREFNDRDPTVPHWAKDQIAIHPPGYPGTLYYNLDASVNAVGQMFETFEDPDQERSTLGNIIQGLGLYGAAPHPLLMAGYAAERALAGDDVGARSYGYLAGITRGFASLTGKTLEPWLWIRDPKTGKRVPWTGGSKWDLEKARRLLGYQEKEGVVPHEAAVLGAATTSGEAYYHALGTVLTQYRRLPVMASLIFGLRMTPKQDWEIEIANWGQKFGAARERGDEELASQILEEQPWLGTVWMSFDNERQRTKALAWDVFERLPPGIDREGRQEVLSEAGITPQMVDSFYTSDGELGDWTDSDVQNFARGVINLAEILGMPDENTAKEWSEARRRRAKLYDSLAKQFPDAQEQQEIYFQLKEAGQKDQAKEFLQSTNLGEYWNQLNQGLISDDLLLRYYAEPTDIDRASTALMHEQAEAKWPGIHKMQNEYYAIASDDKVGRRQYRISHPALVEYWDWKTGAINNIRDMLANERQMAGVGVGVPKTIDYIVDGTPTMAQRAVLEVIDDLEFAQNIEPPPPPARETPSLSPAEAASSRAWDSLYAQVWQKYPEGPQWEKEYDQIKAAHGEEAAKLFAQDVGLYDYWNDLKLGRVANPILLQQMDKDAIQSAAKTIMYQDAQEMWPNIFDIQTGFYQIPENDKSTRRKYLDEHPELKAYWDWKRGAQEYYANELQLRQRQTKSNEAGAGSAEENLTSSLQGGK